ncbi:MAG: DNA phosphorothioation-associated protein 4 [Oscillatoriales cyanobacterium RU_3_3]|nr:DNA phosphorothioation-associated protein 4 [Oscillatoriales cyanobacterium RU_3_3]NJR21334.1 DNA phosphorothioation-associated protein 4 [Richelia sp. CSU_2_1]
MSSNRIRIAKDKAELVKSLTLSDNKSGPFQTYADVIAFAAALGNKRKKRSPLGEISKREPGSIDVDIFVSRGYDLAIKLIAIAETKNPQILSHLDGELETKRLQIFEEYANGGLEILREEFRGAADYTDRLLLFLIAERDDRERSNEEFDLSKFLF